MNSSDLQEVQSLHGLMVKYLEDPQHARGESGGGEKEHCVRKYGRKKQQVKKHGEREGEAAEAVAAAEETSTVRTLDTFEEMLAAVGRPAGMTDKPDVTSAKRWLREQPGGKTIASKLGSLSKIRNGAAHVVAKDIEKYLDDLNGARHSNCSMPARAAGPNDEAARSEASEQECGERAP